MGYVAIGVFLVFLFQKLEDVVPWNWYHMMSFIYSLHEPYDQVHSFFPAVDRGGV